jgi:hypothetical protein
MSEAQAGLEVSSKSGRVRKRCEQDEDDNSTIQIRVLLRLFFHPSAHLPPLSTLSTPCREQVSCTNGTASVSPARAFSRDHAHGNMANINHTCPNLAQHLSVQLRGLI